jgi:hypothetical protein
MKRIYFDKQIFSFLFKGVTPFYEKLLLNLQLYKKSLLFCYSHAHLLDLKNDKTDIKYAELEFMETLVCDNYLSYDTSEKRTSCYLVKPREAFVDIDIEDEPISFSNLFDIDLSSATEEQREQIAKAKDLFTNQKIDFGFSQISNLPEELSEPLRKVLPIGIPSMTLIEWTEHFMEMLKSMENDKTVYKGLRNVIDKHINNGKFTVDFESIDFNDELKNSAIQKSFIEYVNGNLNPNGDKEISDYDFFVNAYFTLDLLGISKEPSKTVKFRTVMNDGIHSYYGAYCDYVVSDDNGFLKKTKAMYKLLNIHTQVLHIDEFKNSLKLIADTDEESISTFFNLLVNDLKNGIVLNSKPSLKYNRYTITIKPYHNYLGYFNVIDSIKEDNQDYIFLSRNTNNYSYFSFFREYQGVINKALKLFGTDYYFKGEFEWDKEIQEIKENTWNGRFWKFDGFTILIELNKGTGKLSLLITTNENK